MPHTGNSLDRVQIYQTEDNSVRGEGNIYLGEVFVNDLTVLDDGSYQTQIDIPSGTLPLDQDQKFSINATLTSSITANGFDENGAATSVNGFNTSEFGDSFELNFNRAPTFASEQIEVNVAEGNTLVTSLSVTDADGDSLDFSTVGGDDQSLFTIDSTGRLFFSTPPDFESPRDSDGDNIYHVTIRAVDDFDEFDTIDVVVVVTNEDEAPFFNNDLTFNANENQLIAAEVNAVDPDNQPLAYFVVDGVGDSDLFDVDSEGTVTFLSAPDFEMPLDNDGDNFYEIRIGTIDSTSLVSFTNITVKVDDVNESPEFINGSTFSVEEGTLIAAQIETTDPENDDINYAVISGVGDGRLFTVDGDGEITFLSRPDFEMPLDSDGDNSYEIRVAANDGTNQPIFTNITVDVTNVNESPEFTGDDYFRVNEGELIAAQVEATDPESSTLTFSKVEGFGDSNLFAVDADGTVRFLSPPDFETPLSLNGNNTYDLRIEVSDGFNPPIFTDINIEVIDVNETPEFTNRTSFDVDEGEVIAAQVTTSDPENDTITYSVISDVRDGGLFEVEADGTVKFLSPPDFETPLSSNNDNLYEVRIAASDGNNPPIFTDIIIEVNDVNETPTFTNGTTFSVDEGELAAAQVTTSDPENDSITYSIINEFGNGNLFEVEADGTVKFLSPPDFETPLGSNNDNFYEVRIAASDGNNPLIFTNINIEVIDVNETPVFTNVPSFDVNEGEVVAAQVTTSDPENDTITYSVANNFGDGNLFEVEADGTVKFLSAPDFETPLSSDNDNFYTVRIVATDGDNDPIFTDIDIEVTDINETPTFTNGTTFSVDEGELVAAQVTTSDPENDSITYTVISGVGDGSLFEVEADGTVKFLSTPDFETPLSSNDDNFYEVRIAASDGNNPPIFTDIDIEVIDVNESPVFTNGSTFSVNEGEIVAAQVTTSDPENDTITYSIASDVADGSLFKVEADGTVKFLSAPDFETPLSSNNDNNYDVRIVATDGDNDPIFTDINIEVTDINETPVFTNGDFFNVDEGELIAAQVTTSDPENNQITYTNVNGFGDNHLFEVDSDGTVRFLSAPDFETPISLNSDNIYDVRIEATDGFNPSIFTDFNIEVDDVNETPVFTNGTTFSVNEGEVVAAQVTTSDPENDTITYSIASDVADGSLFEVEADGTVKFLSAPDFETPLSSNNDNNYAVRIVATDGDNDPIFTDIEIEVTDVNEAPVFTNGISFNVDEGELVAAQVTTTDAENDTVSLTIVGGVGDGDLFEIDADGEIRFQLLPDLESPQDSNGDNVYEITVVADDGEGNQTTQNISVTVGPVNEQPIFIGSGSDLNLSQDESSVETFDLASLFSDPEGQDVDLRIAGGTDADLFEIVNNELTLKTPPEIEGPASPIFLVDIVANDGINDSDVVTFTLQINNINDAPVIDEQSFTGVQDEYDANATFAIPGINRFDADDDATSLVIIGDGEDNDLFEVVDDELKFKVPPTLVDGVDRTYNVTTAINDGQANSNIVSFEIVVENVNDRPEITSVLPTQIFELDQIDAGQGVDLSQLSTFDLDNDTLTLNLDGDNDDNALFTIIDNEVRFISTPDIRGGQQRDYIVSVVANDGLLNSTPETISIVVNNQNDAPVITSIPRTAIEVDENGAPLNYQLAATDLDGDDVTFSIDGGADAAAFQITADGQLVLANSNTAFAGIDATETLEVSVRATDGLASVSRTIRVVLEPEPDTSQPNAIENPQVDNNDINSNDGGDDVSVEEDNNVGNGEDGRPDVIDDSNILSLTSNAQPKLQTDAPQPIDINGLATVADLKLSDDESFFDLTSESIAYLSQYGEEGPQLITQEIGDIIESRRTGEDVGLNKSILAKYFWQGFDDSEDEFIRKNLKVDTTAIVAVPAGLTLGLVSYLRMAAMATSAFTQLPAWKTLDVAPLISAFDEDEAETIHQIVDE